VRLAELERLDGLALHVRRGMGERPGERRFPGRPQASGIEVESHVAYAPGDDLRHLDWNALGRLDTLLVRRFTAEREVVVHLLLDASASMGVPPRDRKLAVACDLALALGYLALVANDALRLTVLGADGPATSPVLRQRRSVARLATRRGRSAEARAAYDEAIAQVPAGDAADIQAAVDAAKAAFPAWSAMHVDERVKHCKQFAQAVRAKAREFGMLDAIDGGNPFTAMIDDAKKGAALHEYFCGLGMEIKGETIPVPGGGLDYTRREPFGVVARIIPFNHPISFAARSQTPRPSPWIAEGVSLRSSSS